MSWGDVTFLYDNIGTYTATSEETGFEAVNLVDGLESTHWTATSTATQEIIHDAGVGNTVTCDFMAIGGHNLSGATVKLEESADAAAYTTVVAGFVVSDNKSLAKLFTAETNRAFKVTITGASVAPYITTLYIGEKVELQKAALYDPYKRKRNQDITYTEGGRVAGAVVNYTERVPEFKFRNCINAIYDKIDTWFTVHGLKAFFVMWEPTEHPTDVWPVIGIDTGFNAPYVVPGELRDISVKVRGLAE
jgi:hypothetical protein